MATKKVRGVIIPRHDTAKNWAKAINFRPKKGELVVFDADKSTYDLSVEINGQSYPVKSSDKVRFKFGDGETNVNALPFATTESSGGGIDEEWLKDYISKHTGAIVYLNTKQVIGRTLELQDVYPIQSDDTKLQIISKNRIIYQTYSETLSGVNININNDEGVKVTGNVTSPLDKYITVGRVNITTPGKYIISVDNDGVLNSDKECYINYSLRDSNNNVTLPSKLTKDSPVIVDSSELNCTSIDIILRLVATSGASFNTSAAQTFHIQVEYGEVATLYTPPKDEINVGNKIINIYGKNLYSGPTSISWPGEYIEINGIRMNIDTKPSLHYVKGVMTEDNNITLSGSQGVQTIYTPLLKGDKFTFTYTYCDTGSLVNLQILYGHVDYTEYEPYWVETTTSKPNGDCDISSIKYPYSFLALENVTLNSGYAIYLSYDPALSRNWTEKQLSDLNNRIDTLESIIKSLTNQ